LASIPTPPAAEAKRLVRSSTLITFRPCPRPRARGVAEPGTTTNGTYAADVPNPVAGMPAGTVKTIWYVFVADDDVRFRDGLDTPVADGETVSIIPAVAGGC